MESVAGVECRCRLAEGQGEQGTKHYDSAVGSEVKRNDRSNL